MAASRNQKVTECCEQISSVMPEKKVETPFKLDDAKARDYVLQIINDVLNTVLKDDVSKLKKLRKVVDKLNNIELLNSLYAEDENPLQKTNIVILACKLNSINVLKYVFCSSNLLHTFSHKLRGHSILPGNEDNQHHNAFYYAIRNSNINILKTLIFHWPSNYFSNRLEELHIILSNAFIELKLKNVEITHEIEFFIESMLLIITFSKGRSRAPNLDELSNVSDVKERIDLIVENVKFLVSEYSENEIDELCLLIMRFIVNSLTILRKELKVRYAHLPWDEISFLLTIFIHSQRFQKMSLIYCTVTKDKMLKYLQNFSIYLSKEENYMEMKESEIIEISEWEYNKIVSENVKRFPEFEEMYCNYRIVRNAYSLERMQNYMETVTSGDNDEKEISILLTRCLQVMKVYMGFNVDIHNLSSIMRERLLLSLSIDTKEILLHKCDSYACTCSSLLKMQGKKTSCKFIHDPLQDINELKSVVTDILKRSKMKALVMLLEHITCSTTLDEIMYIVEILDTVEVSVIIFEKTGMTMQEQIQKFTTHFNNLVVDKTMYEQQLSHEISEIVSGEKSKITSKTNCDMAFSLLKDLRFNIRGKRMNNTDFSNIKHIAKQILMYLDARMTLQSIKKIVELIVEIWNSILPRMQVGMDEMYKNIVQILSIAELEVNQSTWVNEMWRKINKTLFQSCGKEKKNNVIQCKHMEHSHKLYSELNNIIPSSAHKFFGTEEVNLPKLEIVTELFDKFACYKGNKKLQAIVELLVLNELSIISNSEKFKVDASLFWEETCPLLVGKRLHAFLSYGSVCTDTLLFDPCIAIYMHAIILCFDNSLQEKMQYSKLMEYDILELKENHDKNVASATNQRNMFIALTEGKLETVKMCIKNGADINSKNLNLWTALHFAAKGPSVEAVKFLIHKNLDINIRNVNGQNPLHIAAMYGRKSIVEYLIKETNIIHDETDNTGKTPLLFAVQNGFEDIANILLNTTAAGRKNITCSESQFWVGNNYCANVAQHFLKKERSFDDTIDNFTLLHAAAGNGCIELMEILLEDKEYINAKSDIHGTPLHMAAKNGYLQVIKTLISRGACVNDQNVDGCVPLHYAVENGHDQAVKVLLEQGSHVNVVEKTFKYTPLCYASEGGYEQIVKLLLEREASINAISVDGMSPLHLAVMKKYKNIVDLLINCGASVNAKTNDGLTALHLSAQRDYVDILEFLIKNGGDTKVKNKKNQTLLHVSSESGCKCVLRMLIAQNIDINAKDICGFTPLHLSSLNGHDNTLHFLLESGANVNAIDKNRRTALHIAALYNVCNVIDCLLENGASINCKDIKGFTALHLAAMRGNIFVVQKLLKAAKVAKISNADAYGVSPLHVAVQSNQTEVIKILIQNGFKIDANISFGCVLLNDANTDWEEKLRNEVFDLILDDDPIMKGMMQKRYEKLMVYARVYTPLYFAVYNNNSDIVSLLISMGADSCINGSACFLASIYFGYENILDILLRNKNVHEIRGPSAKNLLYVASVKGHVHIVKKLLAKRVHINNVYPMTPLHAAVAKGHSEILELLMEDDVKMNMMDKTGTTLLHHAAFHGHKKVVEVLLKCNKVPAHLRDMEYRTPLEVAAGKGHEDIVKMLLQNKNVDINAKGKGDFTVLHIAAQEGKLEMTKLLVNRGANVNARNSMGARPIHVAAREGHVNVVEFFLNVGVDLHIGGLNNQTCLHYAVAGGQARVVNFLLLKNININRIDSAGITALHVASILCRKDLVKLLLEKGAFFNIVDITNRQTPLEMAVNKDISNLLKATGNLFEATKDNNPSMVERCIQNGGIVNAKNKNNETALIYAAWKGTDKVIEVLLKNEADPNIIGKNGSTPLHYACKYSHFNVVKSLLSHGAVYNIETIQHKTPLDFASKPEIVNLLKLVEKMFKNAENGDDNFISDLKGIQDVDTLKVIASACNRNKETMITCAVFKASPQMEEKLKKVINDMSA